MIINVVKTSVIYFLLSILFLSQAVCVEICFCPVSPNSNDCNGLCNDSPNIVVVIPSVKPKQPSTQPFERRYQPLWDGEKLERFRVNNEKFRIRIETLRIKAEEKRVNLGIFPPKDNYNKNIKEYRQGILKYKENFQNYKNMTDSIMQNSK